MLDQTLARRVERIVGQAELLLNQPNLSDAERSLLDIIRSSAVRLYHYLDELPPYLPQMQDEARNVMLFDLRSPFSTILAACDLLLEDPLSALNASQYPIAEQIAADARYAMRRVERFIDGGWQVIY
jgi:CRP-like cAMP-binding protein